MWKRGRQDYDESVSLSDEEPVGRLNTIFLGYSRPLRFNSHYRRVLLTRHCQNSDSCVHGSFVYALPPLHEESWLTSAMFSARLDRTANVLAMAQCRLREFNSVFSIVKSRLMYPALRRHLYCGDSKWY